MTCHVTCHVTPHSEAALLHRPEAASGPGTEPHTQLLPGAGERTEDRSLVNHFL